MTELNEQLSIQALLPEGFFDLDVSDILQLFQTPTLIELEGERKEALFVSILLHGNEFTGLKAMQGLLQRYRANNLPRNVILFIGNVHAAQQSKRLLQGQQDYNRCWPGTLIAENACTRLMQQVMDRITAAQLFAAIDVHNNTGTNPHYACITDVTRANLHLAAMFNHIGLVFKQPRGVSTMAFDGLCPAATLECGKPGDSRGIEHAIEFLDALLHLDHFPDRPVAGHDLQLVKSLATVKIPQQVSFDFSLNSSADLCFAADFERFNFTEILPHEPLALTRVDKPLLLSNQHGEDITDQLIRQEDGRLYLNRTLMPAMITVDHNIIRQDCLCYLLEDYHPRIEKH